MFEQDLRHLRRFSGSRRGLKHQSPDRCELPNNLIFNFVNREPAVREWYSHLFGGITHESKACGDNRACLA